MKTDDIGILFNFLDQFGPEAAGRGTAAPEAADSAMLERFVQGKCDPAERQNICNLLRQHPSWLRWLAERVKVERPPRAVANQV